jgi:hypothetical protein
VRHDYPHLRGAYLIVHMPLKVRRAPARRAYAKQSRGGIGKGFHMPPRFT